MNAVSDSRDQKYIYERPHFKLYFWNISTSWTVLTEHLARLHYDDILQYCFKLINVKYFCIITINWVANITNFTHLLSGAPNDRIMYQHNGTLINFLQKLDVFQNSDHCNSFSLIPSPMKKALLGKGMFICRGNTLRLAILILSMLPGLRSFLTGIWRLRNQCNEICQTWKLVPKRIFIQLIQEEGHLFSIASLGRLGVLCI